MSNQVRQGNLECDTFFSSLLWNKDVCRPTLWDGIYLLESVLVHFLAVGCKSWTPALRDLLQTF